MTEPLDYASLQRSFMAYLEELAGPAWTDFNPSDPGITILEQLSYALSDLGYRLSFPTADLLARPGITDQPALPRPSEVLSSAAVSLEDQRRLLLDIEGVHNAWLESTDADEPSGPAGPELVYNAAGRAIRFDAPAPVGRLQLSGLYKIRLALSSDLSDDERAEVTTKAVERFYANRAVGEDIEDIEVLEPQKIGVTVWLEIEPELNPHDAAGRCWMAMADYLVPPVRFRSLPQMLAMGLPVDKIFQGPLLDQGFLTREALDQDRLELVLSADLIVALMNIPGILNVLQIQLSDSLSYRSSAWSLPLDPDHAPCLDPENTLFRFRLRGETESIIVVKADERTKFPRDHSALTEPKMFARLVGDPRDLSTPSPPVKDEFPAVYGIGAIGLPASAPIERRVQAQQLETYLGFFDELNESLMQRLADAQELFMPPAQLPEQAGDSDLFSWSSAQRERLLDHLLALFADNYTNSTPPASFATKAAVFRNAGPHYGRRSCGVNMLSDSVASSSLAKVLDLRLGVSDSTSKGVQKLLLVEHILLRPLASDLPSPDLPLAALPEFLASTVNADPWSQQLSCVVQLPDSLLSGSGKTAAEGDASTPANDLMPQIEQVIRREVPAGLSLYVIGVNSQAFTAIESAYSAWLERARASNGRRFGAGTSDPQLNLRATRDRLINLLGFGFRPPLQDVEVTTSPRKVAWGSSITVTIDPAQPGLEYSLVELTEPNVGIEVEDPSAPTRKDKTRFPAPTTIQSKTVTMTELWFDRTLCVWAWYGLPGETQALRHVPLATTLHVVVGLDLQVPLKINIPAGSQPFPDHQKVQLQVGNEDVPAQENVSYELFQRLPGTHQAVALGHVEAPGPGTVYLLSPELEQSTTLLVRARSTKWPDRAEPGSEQVGFLATEIEVRIKPKEGS